MVKKVEDRIRLTEKELAKKPATKKQLRLSTPSGVEVYLCQGGFFICTLEGVEWGRWYSMEGALSRASSKWRKERRGEPDPFQPLLCSLLEEERKKVEESRRVKYPPAHSQYEGAAYRPSDLDPHEKDLYGD